MRPIASLPEDDVLSLNLPMKPLWQPRPVACLHRERDRRIVQRLLEVGQPRQVDLLQSRPPEHEVQVASVMAPAIDTAAVGPDLDIGEVVAEQCFEPLTVTGREMQAVSHGARR